MTGIEKPGEAEDLDVFPSLLSQEANCNSCIFREEVIRNYLGIKQQKISKALKELYPGLVTRNDRV
ncbi:hypothetical protein DGG96_08365 [Legionella qingyii]|uniref:Uncharacterized protein n=1 Tax=Legionella qingyii TaxID=2184757 RepID=A0A317U5S1_9GAMM|nr:hypothetical protein DGG96_08365 [Legionella qingyii]